MNLDKLTDPVFYDELENNKRHAMFLVSQIKKVKEKIHYAREMKKSRTKGEGIGSEECQSVIQLQTELLAIVKDLDETTKRIQVLIGLPNIERDMIEVNKFEVDRLGTNPVLPVKGYGILKNVPKLMVIGGQTVVLPALDEEGEESEDETKSSSRSSVYDSDGSSNSQGERPLHKSDDSSEGSKDDLNNSSFIRSFVKREVSNMLKEIEAPAAAQEKLVQEFKAKQMKLENDKKMLKTQKDKLESLQSENAVIRETLRRLIPEEKTMQDFLQNGPQTEDEMNTFILILDMEKNKMERLVDKIQNEIRQQQRINELLSSGRVIPECKSENQDRVFNLDTEQGLNRESLYYKNAKLLNDEKNEQLENLKNEIDSMKYENEKMKYDLQRLNETVNALHELIDERMETQRLKTDLQIVEGEILNGTNEIAKLNKDEAKLRELLEIQENEINEDRAAFLLIEEHFQREQLLFAQREEEKVNLVKRFQNDIECFKRDMESKFAYYRSLPFVLGTYEAQCVLVESSRCTVIQDSTLIYQDYEFYRQKLEKLARLKGEEEAKAVFVEEKVNQVANLRDHYNAYALKINHIQLIRQNLQNELIEARNRAGVKVMDIECVRRSMETFKEDFAVGQVLSKENHEQKTGEQLKKLNDLEKKLVAKRVILMKAMECSSDEKEGNTDEINGIFIR